MRCFPLTACCVAALWLAVYLAPAPTATARPESVASEATSGSVEAYRANLLTPDEERIVGRRLAHLYEQRCTLLKDELTEARLKRIKRRLGAILAPGLSLQVSVIQSARPEAVSFPPDSIYITSALIRLTATDDELAAVIAHEAAHVRCRHLARLIALVQALPPAERPNFPTREAIVTGEATQFDFPAAIDAVRLRSEMEADQLAALWIEQAGYRDEALAVLLGRLMDRLAPRAQKERAALRARMQSLDKQSFSLSR